jgi:hypothetical protein
MNRLLSLYIFAFIIFSSLLPSFSYADKLSHLEQENLNEQLIYTTAFGRPADIQILLQKGADPNAYNDSGSSVLSIAADRKDKYAPQIAELLIEAGAKVNKQDKNKQYPLLSALTGRNVTMVKFLLANEADFHITDEKGRTPLQIATALEDQESLYALQKAIEEEAELIRKMRSPENRRKQMFYTAYHACRIEYLKTANLENFISAEDTELKVSQSNDKILESGKLLKKIFGFVDKDIEKIINESAMAIRDELGWLGANKNPKRYATDLDIDARCRKIAERWYLIKKK